MGAGRKGKRKGVGCLIWLALWRAHGVLWGSGAEKG